MDNLLRYTSRDYKSIKDDLLLMIDSVNSEWTNREESDPGIMLLSLMSALGDNLSFNMDMQTLEMYLSTVTQRKNCKKLLQLGGYKMHWYRSAIAEVTVINNAINSNITINMNMNDSNNNLTLMSSNGDTTYTIFEPADITSGIPSGRTVIIPAQSTHKFIAVEGSLSSVDIPISAIINNRFYLPETTIDESHLYLYDPSSETYWSLVEDLNLVTEMGRYFEFNVDELDYPYIEFVSYWKSYFSKDNSSSDLRLYYLSSSGSAGAVGDNAFSYIITAPTNSNINEELNYNIVNSTNQYGTLVVSNSPGYDPQTVNEAKADYANYINTYNTLVTLYDFQKFIVRQSGFNVARSIDAQKAQELNEIVFKSYDDGLNNGTTTKKQPVPTSQRDLANLARYRKYVFGGEFIYDASEANLNKDTIGYKYTNSKTIKNYTLNLYTVYLNYDTAYNKIISSSSSDALWTYPRKLRFNDEGFEEIRDLEGIDVAVDNNDEETSESFFDRFTVEFTNEAPFRRYQINDEVQHSLQVKLQSTKIVTVDVEFPQIRVFDWRVKGTLYLIEPVSEMESESIISIVVDALQSKFTPEYVGFGNKIRYMDVIDVISNCDSRIKYFDAGYGVEPLIDYAECFDVENYFNDISIMRFNQYSVPKDPSEIAQYNMDESGNKLIKIDIASIKEDDF